ncbi:MAG: RIP metalloprotease RseP [Peptococcaceae bacterium]|nr:RIP metalloprotease RseP [Peptococcaceae bacterium]
MIAVVSWIFVFGLLIMIHEFGHFIVARWAGVKVLEFSFGFGPKLISHQGKETLYALRLFPLGGFVKMFGMDAEMDEQGKPVIAASDHPRSFMNKSIGKRIAIIAAGPVMNFVLAILLFILVFAYMGIPEQAEGSAIGSLIDGKPAMQAGFREGDQIIRVNGVDTPDWNALIEVIHTQPEQPLDVVIVRDGQQLALNVVTEKDPQTGYGMIGIAPAIVYKQVSVWQSIKYGCIQTVSFTRMIIVTLFQMITGQIPADVGGPVMIAQAVGEAAREGFMNLLIFTSAISIQLGLLNLFPIPALDGSRIIFLLIEGVRGKPVKPERENMIHLLGFALLLLFAVVVTYHDILRLFAKS